MFESIYQVANLKDDEKIILVIRRFPVTLFFPILLSVILVFGPFFLLGLFFSWGKIGIWIFGILMLIAFIYVFRVVTMWYYTTFLVTNMRIIDVYQKGLFDRVFSESTHDIVVDVSYRKKGFWPHMLDYGNIFVITWGATIEIPYVFNPGKKQQIILTESVRYTNEKHEKEAKLKHGAHSHASSVEEKAKEIEARKKATEKFFDDNDKTA